MREAYIIIIFSILIHKINGQQMELIAGHVLFRHGDRTPITTYPSDPIQAKDWPNGFGQLTTAGIEQSYRLGAYFRTRYGSLLNSKYNRSEIYVRSTDFDRALMSAQSNLIGLYPLPKKSESKVPFQPVPIHTVPITQDFLLGLNDCPRYNQVEQDIHETEGVKKLNTYYEPFFQKLQVWTNITNLTMYTIWHLGLTDTIFVEHIYNKTPSWATDDVRKNLTDITNITFQFLYANNDIKRIRGGPLIQEIWKNMDDASHGKSYLKMKMYSAHDTTISGVLSFLGIIYPHQPSYASTLFIDLYKQNSNYFVKVEYLNVTDSKIAYRQVLNGCEGVECPLDKFTSIYQPRFPSNIEVECAEKPRALSMDDRRKNNVIVLITSVIIVSVAIVALIVFIYFVQRKTQYNQPLLSSDTSLTTR